MSFKDAKIIIDKLIKVNCNDEVIVKALIKASTALEIMSETQGE